MEIIQYEIQQGDTLKLIAEKYNLTVKELVDFHNQQCGITQQIIGDKIPIHVISLLIKKENNEVEAEDIIGDDSHARYRCEQSVMTYVGDIMMNHADTKREFFVNKYQENGESLVKVELIENIIETYPEQMNEAVELMSDIDLIACNLLTDLDFRSGKIKNIKNHNEVLEKWKIHKNNLTEKYSYLRNPTSSNDLKNFINIYDDIFKHQEKLISWVNTKMFFDLFFDKYLVSNKGLFDPFTRTAYSQLFEGLPVQLNFRQDIIGETPQTINLRKVSEMQDGGYDIDSFKKIYTEKFLPLVKYKFSEFKLSCRENSTYDLVDRWITKSDVTIIEEIKNNVKIMITYKLTKIEA